MKNKIVNAVFLAAGITFLAAILFPSQAKASDGEEYITITVDAVDDSSGMKYALDSDDPLAFGDSNEFRVPAGTSHTIYVKDEAGNITSQKYDSLDSEPQYDITGFDDFDLDEDTQQINIDLELGKADLSEEDEHMDSPSEPGAASVSSKIKTDGSDDAEKVFYTFTTKEGETLYLIIDQEQGTDNVYLLDTVSLTDLHVLADGQADSYSSEKEDKEDNLLSILNDNTTNTDTVIQDDEKSKSSSRSNGLVVLVIAAIGGGAYYYLKIYRNKKDEAMDVMDAMDMDEFEQEDDEEEIEFDYDDADKEKYLEQLINEEESFYDADPDEYAMSQTEEGEDNMDIYMDSEGDMNEMYDEDSEETEA